jgi:carotenoid cleavage dioxygenase
MTSASTPSAIPAATPSAASCTTGDASPTGLRFPDLLIYRGYAAPVRIEGDVYDLEVIGSIPKELEGTFYRNSADPRFPPLLGSDIFLNGDGMIHMVRIEGGHADLKTRYVRTDKWKAERAARRALFGAYRNPFTDDASVAGMDRGTANTSVMWLGGKLFALKEDSRPMALDPDSLETLGSHDFGGLLRSKTFTAHPKTDPKTREVVAYGFNTQGIASPTIELFFIDSAGVLTRTERFDAPYASMVHDFMLSEHFIAFTICPMICDWDRVKAGKPYFHWDGRLATKIAVIPRKPGGAQRIRWFTAPAPCMETHTFNAWEQGSILHLEHFVTATGWLSQFPDLNDPDAREQPPFAYRWSFDLASPEDRYTSERLFPQVGEMPMIDLRFLTRQTEHFWFGTTNKELGPLLEPGPKGPPFTCLGHWNARSGALEFYYSGPHSAPEEPVFVPRAPDSPQGDGWLLSLVGRRAENRTDLVILDARRLSAGPVATIRFPARVHEGFHGIWVPASQRTPGSDRT